MSRYLIILLLFVFTSCGYGHNDVNQLFNEEFGNKIDKVKIYRSEPESLKNKTFSFRSPTRREIEKSFIKSKYNKYRYIDVSQFNEVQEDYFDNKIQSGQLSPRIFDITYYTKNHGPFIIEEDHFANIDIPEYDAYGLATRFSSKPYLLVSDKSIKDGVDYISNNNRDSNHIKQSQSLIKERMELRRKQRMQKLYQNPSLK